MIFENVLQIKILCCVFIFSLFELPFVAYGELICQFSIFQLNMTLNFALPKFQQLYQGMNTQLYSAFIYFLMV